jgi:7-cyano-7-deazaguanine synthase
MKKIVLALSGGLDSAVLLAEVLKSYDRSAALCLSFDYGSKHAGRESACSRLLAEHYDVERIEIDLVGVIPERGSSLTDPDVPVPDGPDVKSTVVPCRNLIFGAVMASEADSLGAKRVALGVHAGDRQTYPDCRYEFVDAMSKAVKLATEGRVDVYAPFVDWDKSQIVAHGALLGVPFEKTWSCYAGGDRPCGLCGACVTRREAFAKARLADPA